MYSVIHNEELLEQKIAEIKVLALSLNESSVFPYNNKYPKQIFAPLESYLEESFISGLLKKGKDFADKFTKGAKEIAIKVSGAIKEFSFKKVFATIAKMMNKIKSKVLKGLMTLLAPLREVIVKNGFCSEDNKFEAKATFRKLVSVAKETGAQLGAKELLNDTVVSAIQKNVNLEGTGVLSEAEEDEAAAGKAKFDEEDVKYMDFFQKMMFKLGIKDAKLNGFFSEISKKITTGAAITGVFAVVGALLPSMGIISGIAAAAGAAVAAAPVLVMIIGAILFGIGLFMFATWLLKPYPTIENCRIFLATIFEGAHPFDFPDANLDDLAKNVKPEDEIKPRKPAFNTDLILDLEEEGVEEDIPGGEDLEDEVKDIIKRYDDLDIEILEDDDEVENNKVLAKIFVRNVSTEKGREKILAKIEDIKEDEEDNEYTEALEEFLGIIDEIYSGDAVKEETEDGKKKYPYALNYKKTQEFLRSKNNSVADRMTKVIDVTDNFIDRIDKIGGKSENE
jgi:ElaB/YqjD/DUF883 family membrane-anchored ribosome-binding protein